MKGFSFYAEMTQARQSKRASAMWNAFTRETLRDMAAQGDNVNVCAVAAGTARSGPHGGIMYDVVSSLLDIPNSPVCTSSASVEYLRRRTVRIDEALARKLHPALFASNLL